MYDHILLPVDGSEEAKRAARYGLKLAQTVGATVTILHVVEQKSLYLTKTDDEKTRLRERGEEILAEIEELASEIGQSITTELREGKPAVQICEYASKQDTALIVMGRQGETGLGKRLLGGVTERVLHRGDIPVLVVPDGDRTMKDEIEWSRILLPTDGSENAEEATQHGVTVAQHSGATIHILNVVDLQAAGGVFNAGGLEKEFVQRLEERGKEAVNRIAKEVEETASDLDVEMAVKRSTSFDGVVAGLREYAMDNQIDLIVMGSHGRSTVERQLLGSVTSTLLRTADVPILVVKRSP